MALPRSIARSLRSLSSSPRAAFPLRLKYAHGRIWIFSACSPVHECRRGLRQSLLSPATAHPAFQISGGLGISRAVFANPPITTYVNHGTRGGVSLSASFILKKHGDWVLTTRQWATAKKDLSTTSLGSPEPS